MGVGTGRERRLPLIVRTASLLLSALTAILVLMLIAKTPALLLLRLLAIRISARALLWLLIALVRSAMLTMRRS